VKNLWRTEWDEPARKSQPLKTVATSTHPVMLSSCMVQWQKDIHIGHVENENDRMHGCQSTKWKDVTANDVSDTKFGNAIVLIVVAGIRINRASCTNLLMNLHVKGFWKLAESRHSYRHEFGVFLFGTQRIYYIHCAQTSSIMQDPSLFSVRDLTAQLPPRSAHSNKSPLCVTIYCI